MQAYLFSAFHNVIAKRSLEISCSGSVSVTVSSLNEFYIISKMHFCAVQAAYVFFYTLDALISARKEFLTYQVNLSNSIIATLVSLHYHIYKIGMKLAIFKISYLNQLKWQKLVLMNTFYMQGSCQRISISVHIIIIIRCCLLKIFEHEFLECLWFGLLLYHCSIPLLLYSTYMLHSTLIMISTLLPT